MVATDSKIELWDIGPRFWLWSGVLFGISVYIFFDGLKILVGNWTSSEEYSHGLLIPFITAFLIWQKKNELARLPFEGSWIGFGIVALGLGLYFLGELATLYIIVQYAFLVVLLGLVLAVTGTKIFKQVWIPLLFLFFAIPLPNFLYQGLSSKLQLLSSALGVSFIRACDISVYLEGNVIDLGSYKLQVVEACNGLRYLFPLMSLAFMCAYFFKGALWKRGVIFLSSIPITILMNSFRIGIIGVMVEYWGQSMAEGFLHDFEGWAIFMACTGLLVGEMWLLARIGKEPRPLLEVFGLTFPEPLPKSTKFRSQALPRQFWSVFGLSVAALVGAQFLQHRSELVPSRAEFIDFPMQLADWTARRETMEQQYVDALKFDDYILANYTREGSIPVNFYSAYYANQRKGESIHSPRSCIPGGGWQIKSLETVNADVSGVGGNPLRINRLVIQKGDDRQLVYYWFQQRGRNLTNEYSVKWYLFWDALTLNRTDGALVRLTTYLPRGEDLAKGEARLDAFLSVLQPQLSRYIPD
ncbi:EpsI family protein [Methylocaldum marinum]|uniref:EpsI family protein n=1 Tax=Methylocaldum marinum TaxID=1432792 RepID=A0A286P3Z0_9GAMM|nr:VPLPA-CTERM-specific exosortase XrtD [Methylocaldum marinum]BBA32362.1 EpsI family protein [Methylocaldum marinum]